ncbi:TetR/AcrR family transcriptional regulator [Candidatus Binatus soli]|jgi:AcrR family transcriptional regulator|uniref:TetR/AcrR family transcriptional regulator n=1 Tax=Candidatus Binatus soli TaxID=1953413 RepID=UPI003D136CD7
MGLREEKKARQRREIMDQAVALFRKRGYDQTRVQDIIARLRISEATFFNYFPTKDAILQEFALDQVEQFIALLKHEMGVRGRSVPDRLRELMRVIAQVGSQDRKFMAVVTTRSNLFSATGEIRNREFKMYELLAELFAEGQARGEIRDDVEPMQLAEILTGIYTLTGNNWLIGWWNGSSEMLEQRLLRALDVFLAGSGARSLIPEPPRRPHQASRRRAGRRRKT